MKKVFNFINGKKTAPLQGNWLPRANPATGIISTLVADSTLDDLESSLKFSKSSQEIWEIFSMEKRCQLVDELANIIEKNSLKFAQLESLETGKPLTLARSVDLPRSISNFRYFSRLMTGHREGASTHSPFHLHYTLKSPVGIVGLITPWNLPLYLFTWKLAPALLMGNAVIAKVSEWTPSTAVLLAEMAGKVGFPPGLIQILQGSGPKIGREICCHPDVKAISFTGGTETGKEVYATAARQLKKVSLELGGKNPALIFEDADLKKHIPTLVRSAFQNQGEICLCNSRFFIQNSIYQTFKTEFLKETVKWQVGDPENPDIMLGPLISQTHRERVESYVDLALKEGGKILSGGSRTSLKKPLSGGFFYNPTVIENLPPNGKVMQEEIFAPVVCFYPFETEQEALSLANDIPYGLAGTVWTENLNRALRVSRALQTGMVWVNCWMIRDLNTPFGGVKNSGVGREGGEESLSFFSNSKNVCISGF